MVDSQETSALTSELGFHFVVIYNIKYLENIHGKHF